jgi:hypothetical protein
MNCNDIFDTWKWNSAEFHKIKFWDEKIHDVFHYIGLRRMNYLLEFHINSGVLYRRCDRETVRNVKFLTQTNQ